MEKWTFFVLLLFFLFSASLGVKPARATKTLRELSQPHAQHVSHLRVLLQQQQGAPQQQQRVHQQQQVFKRQRHQIQKLQQQPRVREQQQQRLESEQQSLLLHPGRLVFSPLRQQQQQNPQQQDKLRQRHQQQGGPLRRKCPLRFSLSEEKQQQQIFGKPSVGQSRRKPEQQQRSVSGLRCWQQQPAAAAQQASVRGRLLASRFEQQERQTSLREQHCDFCDMKPQSLLFSQQQLEVSVSQHEAQQHHLPSFGAQQRPRRRASGEESHQQLQKPQRRHQQPSQTLEQQEQQQSGRKESQQQQQCFHVGSKQLLLRSQEKKQQQQEPLGDSTRRQWPAAAALHEIEGKQAAGAAEQNVGRCSSSRLKRESNSALRCCGSSRSSGDGDGCSRSNSCRGKIFSSVAQFPRRRERPFTLLFFFFTGVCTCSSSILGHGRRCSSIRSSTAAWGLSSNRRRDSAGEQQSCKGRSSCNTERNASPWLCVSEEERAPGAAAPVYIQICNKAASSSIRRSRPAGAMAWGGSDDGRRPLGAAAVWGAVHASDELSTFPPAAGAAVSAAVAAYLAPPFASLTCYALAAAAAADRPSSASAGSCGAGVAAGRTTAAAAAPRHSLSATCESRAAAAGEKQRGAFSVAAAARAGMRTAAETTAAVAGRRAALMATFFQQAPAAPRAPATASTAHQLQQQQRRQATAAAAKRCNADGQKRTARVGTVTFKAADEGRTSAAAATIEETNTGGGGDTESLRIHKEGGQRAEEEKQEEEEEEVKEPVRKLLHVRLRVKNLEKMVRFYKEVLHMEVLGYAHRPALQEQQQTRSASGAAAAATAAGRGRGAEEEEGGRAAATAANEQWSGQREEIEAAAVCRETETGSDSSSSGSGSERKGKNTSHKERNERVETFVVSGQKGEEGRSGKEEKEEEEAAAAVSSYSRRSYLLPPHIFSHDRRDVVKEAESLAAIRAAVEAAEKAGPTTLVLLGYPPPPATEKKTPSSPAGFSNTATPAATTASSPAAPSSPAGPSSPAAPSSPALPSCPAARSSPVATSSPVAAASAAVDAIAAAGITTASRGGARGARRADASAAGQGAAPAAAASAAASSASSSDSPPSSTGASPSPAEALSAELSGYFVNSLKIELSYTPAAAAIMEQQVDIPTAAEDEAQKQQFLLQLQRHMQGLCTDLPALNRAREFEKKRDRLDRQCHGFIGFTCSLPSLLHLSPAAVAAAGGKLYQLPAKRKVVPSMIPDEHARKDIWVTSAYLLDPEGNGIEVQQQTRNSSISLSPEKALQQLRALRSWEAYMQDQERDIRKEELKQQIALLEQHLQQQQRGGEPGRGERNGAAAGGTQEGKPAARREEEKEKEEVEEEKEQQQVVGDMQRKEWNRKKQKQKHSLQLISSGAEHGEEEKDDSVGRETGGETAQKKTQEETEKKMRRQQEEEEKGDAAEEEAERLRVALGIRLVDKPRSLEEQLLLFKETLRVMEEKEKLLPVQKYVPLRVPLTPTLQKVRLYTGRMFSADRFYVQQLKMKVLRFKSHLFERLYPWSRFAAVSKTFACRRSLREAGASQSVAETAGGEGREAAGAAASGRESGGGVAAGKTGRAAAGAATRAAGMEAAAAAGMKEFAAMEKFAHEGDGSSIPAEWESESSTNPAAAAVKVYLTEAAERQLPQLETVYAYDEDVIRIHPCFGYLAVGVEDVLEAVAACHANAPRSRRKRRKRQDSPKTDEEEEDEEDEDLDEEDEDEAAAEEEAEEALATSPCVGERRPPRESAAPAAAGGTCSSSSSVSENAQVAAAKAAEKAAIQAMREKLKRFGVQRDSAVVFDRDGYPIKLMSLEAARRHYEMMYSNLLAHRRLLASAAGSSTSPRDKG